jgi:CBS domain containing-hemolysin-like protein
MTVIALLAAVALLLANGFFVAAEFAAVGVRRAQIEPLAATSRRARRVLEAQKQLSLMLAGAQLGITLCSLGLGAVAEPTVAALLEDVLHVVHLPADLSHPLAFVIALTLVVWLHMVVGEMVPKNISLATSERAALLLVPALATFVKLSRPLISAFNRIANGFLRLIKVEPQDELKSAYTPDELADILAESRAEGLLDAGEHDRLTSALQLESGTAADVVIPIDRLVTVPPTATSADLEALTVRTGFSRFPVVGSDQALLGFVHVKDVLSADANYRAGSHLRPMPRVAADAHLPEVLAALRQGGSHLGIVEDQGRPIGVVALEDVVEVFVGDIADGAHRRTVEGAFHPGVQQ